MYASALPKTMAMFVETSFCVGPADWNVNAQHILAINPDVSGIAQASVENENIRPRPFAVHKHIKTLRNSELPFSMYMHAKPTHAAEAAAATAFHLSDLLKASLGGVDLGWGIGVVSSEAEETDELEIGADPGYAIGDFIYPVSAATGEGQFYRILGIAAGPPVTLTLDRDLHFTPDPGGADRVYAVIDCFIYQAALTDHSNASHITLQYLVEGEHAEDVYVLKGCKPTLSIEAITMGEPTKLSFSNLVTTFAFEDATKVTLSTTPAGEAGAVPSIGDSSLVFMADHGDPLATLETRGSLTVDPGVAFERIASVNGFEGVAGHIAGAEAGSVEIMVPFDNSYSTDYRDAVEKHMLIQIGNTTSAWGLYFPQLEIASEPARSDEGGQTTTTLSFKTRENQDSVGALTGSDAEKMRSPFHLLIVA